MPNRDMAAALGSPAASPAGRQGEGTRSPAETCREVEQTPGGEPGDRVRCAHLFGDYYRCNWWSRAGVAGPRSGYDWAGLLTDHVRASSFLRVTAAGGRLKVEAVAPGAARVCGTG